MPRPHPSRDLSHLLALLAAVVVIASLYLAKVVLIPLALAILFTLLLTPFVTWLERIRFPRILAVLFVVAVSFGVTGAVGWVVVNQLVDVTSQLPSYRKNIQKKLDALHGPKTLGLNKASEAVKQIGQEIAASPIGTEQDKRTTKSTKPSGSLPPQPVPVQVMQPQTNPLDSLHLVLGPAATAGIVIVFTIFMLIRREDVRNRFIRLAGRGHLNRMTQALDEASGRIIRYILLQTVVNVSYGVVVGIALHFIGLPNALLWGVVAGTFRFLPYVGPLTAALLPVALSLAVFDGWNRTLIILGLFAVLELLVANFIEPVLYGAHTGISSLAILVSAVFWTLLWGPIGLLLATPLTVCLVVLGRYVPNMGFLNILLSDEPVLPPEAQYYQRLLATDEQEARQVLEAYLKEKPLEELYDAVLIPALSLAEVDRHRNDLDEATEKFITQSTRELVEDLYENGGMEPAQQAASPRIDGQIPPGNASQKTASASAITVACVPARDEADEIVGMMLSQLLERAGHRAYCVPIGATDEMLARVAAEKPDIVCVSALPPFALAHARGLYKKLRAHSPDLKIVVGLWNYPEDPAKAAARISAGMNEAILTTLAQAIRQIAILSGLEAVPEIETSR